jgi:hypothetical protein
MTTYALRRLIGGRSPAQPLGLFEGVRNHQLTRRAGGITRRSRV